MDIESLAHALSSKGTPVSSCTYALIEHFCTQLTDIRRDQSTPPAEATRETSREAARLVAWWQADFSAIHGDLSFRHSSNAKVKPDWLRKAFGIGEACEPLDILLAAETCFSLLVRVVAYRTVAEYLGEADALERLAEPCALADVIHGDFFERHNIHNYCFPDAYSWFLSVWNKNTTQRLEAWLAALDRTLAPAAVPVAGTPAAGTPRAGTPAAGTPRAGTRGGVPDGGLRGSAGTTWHAASSGTTGDSFKRLYEALFPRQLRHALGEFYTPEWLAQYTVAETFAKAGAVPWQSVCLDPTCGSGTFLQALITTIRRDGRTVGAAPGSQTESAQPPDATARPTTPTEQLQRLCQVVRGFDVNLLAVVMARTNFLLSVLDLWDGRAAIDLPVDWFDVIDRPHAENSQVTVNLHGESISVTRGEGAFGKYGADGAAKRPDGAVVIDKRAGGGFGKSGVSLSVSLLADADLETAATRERAGTPVYESLRAAYIANRLRGAARQPVDIVVGNPPWVNWEYLSKSVRERTHHLWQAYALFDASGRNRALAKEDLSTLLTYAVADRDLQPGGCLGFVLRQAVFKSKQNGAGFRRLQIGRSGPHLQIVQVDDLTLLQPFPGATTATAVVLLRKAAATAFPVPWRVWRPRHSGERPGEHSGEHSGERPATSRTPPLPPTVTRDIYAAWPVRRDETTSPWITLPSTCILAADRILGRNAYQARTGTFTGGGNAVFWIRVEGASEGVGGTSEAGLVRVHNVTERAKREAPSVTADVEALFVYPLLRGADVRRWHAEPQLHLLCPHTSETRMAAVPRPQLEQLAPHTLAYFDRFTDVLRARRGFSWDRVQLERTPYAIQRIGTYTFAPYKVVWRYIATSFITAVVSFVDDPVLGRRLVLPNEKLMFIPTDDEAEAYYLCGVLSSTPVRACIEQVMNPTSISAHVLDNIAIPTFDRDNPLHLRISELCYAGHALLRTPGTEAPLSAAGEGSVIAAAAGAGRPLSAGAGTPVARPTTDGSAVAASALAEVEAHLDATVSTLYGLTPADLTGFAELIVRR
ncbi:hypothetical protein [Alicyclobacillus sp. ALC3]|uniref:hypothetical protein n=1 Tax=Alicyclobacillus sp. ALC3 TaxID=2796143 RepID=UPI002379D67A|nr:hypothetical protein [Alicyclobacillus sp. ALC3]WDL99056.1 hypothetical protein JC200_10610 [Alicyclobacillus sp. ALC3]